jgi:hypothetical protein
LWCIYINKNDLFLVKEKNSVVDDTFLYTLHDGELYLLVFIYVNDIMVNSKNSSVVTKLFSC